MGIHGIYKEIGSGQRIALAKFAVETFERTGRPLRIAIDTSIWLFQIQSGKGGSNPALRTFYYRLLRLMSLSIHPLFVFDGPNKPPFKRNKRTGPNIASIPELLAKHLLKHFGFPSHKAPGEAEAECALLQREGIVDAVLSEDVDTLMFGSGLTLRNWSPEQSSNKTPTHVNLYDAVKTKSGTSGLDREGMVLVALMSGGDYIPGGITGCGPKLACEAARAGFGKDLCAIKKGDSESFRIWRERLSYELRTNESKYFRTKHAALEIPETFPDAEVLRYYTHPAISSQHKVESLRSSLRWDQPIDFPKLREFTGEAFDWTKLGGAKKFIRNLAPALLVRELRLKGFQDSGRSLEESSAVSEQNGDYVRCIHKRRNHPTTDGVSELQVSFRALDIVPIDLEAEEPDDELVADDSEDESGAFPATQIEQEGATGPTGSPSKKRAPSQYDPDQIEKAWIFEHYVKIGASTMCKEWEESFRDARTYLAMKHATQQASKRGGTKKSNKKQTAPVNTLDRFTRVMKPTSSQDSEPSIRDKVIARQLSPNRQPLQCLDLSTCASGLNRAELNKGSEIIDLSASSPPAQITMSPVKALTEEFPALPPTVTKRDRRRLPRHRSVSPSPSSRKTDAQIPRQAPMLYDQDNTNQFPPEGPSRPASPASMQRAKRAKPNSADPDSAVQLSPSQKAVERNPRSTPRRRQEAVISLLSSSPARQTTIRDFFSPPTQPTVTLDLADIMRRSQRISPVRVVGDAPEYRQSTASNTLLRDLTCSAIASSRRSTSRTESAEIRPAVRRSLRRNATAPAAVFDEIDLTTQLVSLRGKHVDASQSQRPPAPPAQQPIGHSVPTQVRPGRQRKGVIRVRDSLPGAFAMEGVDFVAVTQRPVAKRGATSQNAATAMSLAHDLETRHFETSQIDMIDLTGIRG